MSPRPARVSVAMYESRRLRDGILAAAAAEVVVVLVLVPGPGNEGLISISGSGSGSAMSNFALREVLTGNLLCQTQLRHGNLAVPIRSLILQ